MGTSFGPEKPSFTLFPWIYSTSPTISAGVAIRRRQARFEIHGLWIQRLRSKENAMPEGLSDPGCTGG